MSWDYRSLCVRSTPSCPKPDPGPNTWIWKYTDGRSSWVLDQPWVRKEQIWFPYGYVRLDLLPASFLICCFWAPYEVTANTSTGSNTPIHQVALLPSSPLIVMILETSWNTFFWKFFSLADLLSIRWLVSSFPASCEGLQSIFGCCLCFLSIVKSVTR